MFQNLSTALLLCTKVVETFHLHTWTIKTMILMVSTESAISSLFKMFFNENFQIISESLDNVLWRERSEGYYNKYVESTCSIYFGQDISSVLLRSSRANLFGFVTFFIDRYARDLLILEKIWDCSLKLREHVFYTMETVRYYIEEQLQKFQLTLNKMANESSI